jgi:hypothetical protein
MSELLNALMSLVLCAVSLATILLASVVIGWWLARLAKNPPATPPRDDGPTHRNLLAHDTARRRSQRMRRADLVLPPVAFPLAHVDCSAQGEQTPPWEASDALDEPPDLWQAHLEALRDRYEAATLDML